MKKIILIFGIFIIFTLTSCDLFVEKSEAQITILEEVDIFEKKSNYDVVKPIKFYPDDILLYTKNQDSHVLSYLIYKASITGNSIDLVKEFSGEYKYITAIYYSNNDNKIYVGAYSNPPHKKRKELPPSYILKLNTNMEIEASVKVDYEITNFFEVGEKIYIECNTEHIYNMGDTNNKTMHQLDKESLMLKEAEDKYIICNSYKAKNGNTVLVKIKKEDIKELRLKGNAVDAIVEIVDKDEKVIKSDEVKKVYPYDSLFAELSNGNIVFNLQKGTGMKMNNQIYVYEKNNENYELIHKKNIKIPNPYTFSGLIENDNGLGILISELELYDGKNKILLYNKNFNKLIKKYEINNTFGNILTRQIKQIDGKTILVFDNEEYIRIGEINLEE